MNNLPKILVILGPTASGKTGLALSLAQKFDGEIINADSRQIYQEMSVGTEKPEGVWQDIAGEKKYLVEKIPHYLMDIISPSENYSLAQFKKQAEIVIKDILARKKVPIIVGGTGQYISAITNNFSIPAVLPNKKIRQELAQLTLEDLQNKLKKLDPESYKIIDIKNPRRIIRALEVVLITGKSFVAQRTYLPKKYEFLKISFSLEREQLYEKINFRVEEQIKRGLVEEVKKLWEKYGENFLTFPAVDSISYREIIGFLQNKYSLKEAIELIKLNTRHYAKRQITWFKRDKEICFIRSIKETESLVEKFLDKKKSF